MKASRLTALAVLAAPVALLAPAHAQTTQTPAHDHHEHHAPPAQPDPHAGHQQPADHSAHTDHDAHAGHDMAGHDMTGHDMAAHMAGMTGAYGAYPMSRDASGTSWQPDAASHGGVHSMAGDWMLMSHLDLQGVYSSQGGPRGDDKAFLAGMAMVQARRDFASGDTLKLQAMLSPDPLMGKSGYPLLLAAGETADGVHPLVDRQHPHDLFMELSASYSKRLSEKDSVFIYGGLPGEPAFGPPAFMHRPAAIDSPEAPITHHWLDSTHITFGVLTAGWVHDRFKLEVSRFRGREPDQHRYDIETGELDSTAVRISWNPTPNWALQASWAEQISPEQLSPDGDAQKWSASALYTGEIAGVGKTSFTGAFARKDGHHGDTLDAWLGEASLKPNDRWTVFARAEAIQSDELGPHHGHVEDVSKLSVGVVRDFKLAPHVTFGVGALLTQNWVSDALSPSYGGDPTGGMGFIRLKVG